MNFKKIFVKVICPILVFGLSLSCGVPGVSSTPTLETAGSPLRVLFIGNSFTFFNDLPGMFVELAQSGGHVVEVEMIAWGGWTCADHANSAETLDAIAQGNWDYVILQEQSQLPVLVDQRDEKMYSAIRLLDEKIRASGAAPILFMTWARKDGLPEQGLSDYFMMQDEVQSGYLEIANELDAIVAPVGVAWKSVLLQEPHFSLWNADGIHPGQEGTYLMRLFFMQFFFNKARMDWHFTPACQKIQYDCCKRLQQKRLWLSLSAGISHRELLHQYAMASRSDRQSRGERSHSNFSNRAFMSS